MGQIELTLFFCDDKPNETGRIIICVHKQLSTLFCSNNNQPEKLCVCSSSHSVLLFCARCYKISCFFLSSGRTRHFTVCERVWCECVCVCVVWSLERFMRSMQLLQIICFNNKFLLYDVIQSFVHLNISTQLSLAFFRIECRAEYKRFVELFTRFSFFIFGIV